MDSLSDASLMLKVKSGDTEKLGLLYERYKKRLFGFFYQMNHNVDLSEDLVQNVFIKILKYKHNYSDESKFLAWIFQIARNVSYDNYNKSKKEQNNINLTDVAYKIDNKNNAEQTIASNEDLSTLKIAMQKLTYEESEILILSKFKELKYKEIGEIIGCSEGSARIRAHRALNELKVIFFKLEKR